MRYERESGKPKNGQPTGYEREPRLILASSSKRRQELLRSIVTPFKVEDPGDIDEHPEGLTDPRAVVESAARAKASAVVSRYPHSEKVVLAADTIIAVDEEIYGKPLHIEEARRTLAAIQGRTHEALTAYAIVCCATGESELATVCTSVTVRALSDRLIEWYLQTREPLGKAGAYAIQGMGGLLVSRIDGDFYAVVGLPIGDVAIGLERAGIEVFGDPDKRHR